MPSQHADLSSSRSLYWKLKKLKLLHLLKHDWRRDVCDDVLTFYDLHGRIPRRQNVQTDEQRAEDKLAQRWDRVLTQKASLSDALLDAYSRIFAATDREADDTHLAVCMAVSEFFATAQRLPKRQNGVTEELRQEDALAQRWDRLLTQKASLSDALLDAYSRIFAATDREADDTHLAVCMAVSDFYETAQRLPRRQNGVTEELRQEDALAQRWDRLLTQKASLSDALLDAYSRIFAATDREADDTHLAVCMAVSDFYETAQRLPRRQNGVTEELRQEDALAQRWDRLLTKKASLSDTLLDAYSRIFAATDREADDTHLAVCMAVSDFYETAQRLPKRQNGVTEELRQEDALARRWDRLLTQEASLSDALLDAYSRIFAASEIEASDTHLAVCMAVSEFFATAKRLPRRQVVDSDKKRAEDVLARRWHRVVAMSISSQSRPDESIC